LIAGLVTAYERSMASPRRGADSSSTAVTSSSVPR